MSSNQGTAGRHRAVPDVSRRVRVRRAGRRWAVVPPSRAQVAVSALRRAVTTLRPGAGLMRGFRATSAPCPAVLAAGAR